MNESKLPYRDCVHGSGDELAMVAAVQEPKEIEEV